MKAKRGSSIVENNKSRRGVEKSKKRRNVEFSIVSYKVATAFIIIFGMFRREGI